MMLRVLLAKDLRRALRNPVPWIVNLALPLCMTALIGLAFGGKSDSGALSRIRFAVVDEDQSMLTGFLRGAVNQGEGGKYFEPVFLDREAAMRLVNDNKISAVLIIPTNFARGYLTGSQAVSLELVKNPAESIHPAVLEEMLGAVVTGLSAIARNFQSEFPDWREVLEGHLTFSEVSVLVERTGKKFESARDYVNPPLITYTTEKPESGPATATTSAGKDPKSVGADRGRQAAANIFAYLLVGLSAMFMLFLASSGMSDLLRELRQRTFERYHTLQHRLLPFVTSKVVFTVVMLLLGAAVLLGAGALCFGIQWRNPLALIALTVGYAGFAAGLMAFLTALMPGERRTDAIHNIIGMALGLAGGCAFPPQNLPGFVREHITPWLPPFWFADTLRNLQFSTGGAAWWFPMLKLAVATVVLMILAAALFQRRFKAGLRA